MMYGRGYVCVDEAVEAFILDGTPPPTMCELEAATPYSQTAGLNSSESNDELE